MEETIIFALIERSQFLRNPPIYKTGIFGNALKGESLVGFLLRETERTHAKVRRYCSPDEHPFYEVLEAPILPELHLDNSPIQPNTININDTIRKTYEHDMIPLICHTGDDNEYGSAAVCDVACLQALSKRIHYGKFVAESKRRNADSKFQKAISSKNPDAIMDAITDKSVEDAVLQRVAIKAGTYTRELCEASLSTTVAPEIIVDIYRKWIIPLNKQVQVSYLLET